MMTSCSPGWVKFVEQFYPEFIPNISTCKSPQQMMGAIVKGFWAPREGLDPARVVSVSIMPCTAKKYECNREEMRRGEVQDVDYVLTTRELARLLRMFGVDLDACEPESPGTPFGNRSSAGKLFGATGGVMEAAVRTAHFLITGKELPDLKLQAFRGLKDAKELHAQINGIALGAAVINGLGNARSLLEQIRAGRDDLHFIEVMTCPGGCIGGGGQPYGTNVAAIRGRMQALYKIDRESAMRTSHANPDVRRLYDEFLGQPLGEKSHQLLHTHYHKREVFV